MKVHGGSEVHFGAWSRGLNELGLLDGELFPRISCFHFMKEM